MCVCVCVCVCVWGAGSLSSNQPASPECPWCHLRIMGKECSQLFLVLIISDVEEMEGLWVDASLVALQGEKKEEEEGRDRLRGQSNVERGK